MASVIIPADYFELSSTVTLRGLLGKDAELLPLRLLCHLHKTKRGWKDGTLRGYSAAVLEATLNWWGGKGEAEEALIKVGVIEKIEDGYQVKDWIQSQKIIISQRIKASKGGLAVNHRRSPGHARGQPGVEPGRVWEVSTAG